jgi:uncharacterized protein DUF3105
MRRRSALLAALVVACTIASAHAQGRQLPDEGQQHIPSSQSGTYRSAYPPASGQHWGNTWADWKMYDEPLPPEVFVHNLEHGGIVLLYRCDTPCPQLVTQLRALHRTFPNDKHGKVKLAIAPDRKITSPIVILAWTWIDELPAFDRERLLRFYRAHVDRGPEDVP